MNYLEAQMKSFYAYKSAAIWVVFLLLLFSCSRKIEIERFDGVSNIEKGEKARLDWSFGRVDYVLIDGYKGEFQPQGWLEVQTERSKSYKFTAINYFDTLHTTWRVNVKGDIQTGGENSAFPGMSESFKPSGYVSGIVSSDDAEPNKMKIMSYGKVGSVGFVDFLLLDKYGNHIRDILSRDISLSISDIDGKKYSIANARENWVPHPQSNLNVHILADNSASAEKNDELLDALKDYSNSYALLDNFDFEWFNSFSSDEYNQISLFQDSFEDVGQPTPAGLNSVFKSCNNLLTQLDTESGFDDILVIFIFSNDNSSIFYDAADVANIAREKSVRVYPVIIGTAVNTNTFKYIANSSGGRLYYIDENAISDAKKVLQEIIFGQKLYYTLQFDASEIYSNTNLTLSLKADGTLVMDNFKIMTTPEPQYSDYQAIACFAFKDTTVKEEFEPHIALLAELMKANPAMTVELIGHCGIEGNEEASYSLALTRAQNVRKLLLAGGVEPKQIRVVSEGSSKPIYYLEQSGWQAYYNRRVEIRWIVPEQLPYEILAESLPSEEQALQKVEDWEHRGYKSYYDRYLKNNNSMYRVRIWGFATIDEANSIATKLKNKYKIAFEVR